MLTTDIARLLEQDGRYRPLVCAWRCGGGLQQRLEEQGIDYRVLDRPRRPVWMAPLCLYDVWGAVRATVQLIREEGIDVVHAHMSESAFIAALAGPRANCPVVITMHNTVMLPSDIPRASPIYALRHAMLKWSLKRATRVIACSDAAKTSVVEQMKLPADDVDAVPNGIVVSSGNANVDRAGIRRSLGLREQHRVLICVGRLRRYKGQGTLIEMMPRLLESHPMARLVLCGTGHDEKLFRQHARQLAVEDKVLFLGSRSDIPALLRTSDVYVTASQWEGLSLSLLEAMDAELAVVSTPAPGNTQVLEDGAGVIARSMDASAMLESVVRVLNDSSFAAALGKCARQRVIDEYSSDRMIGRLISIYDEVLDTRAGTILAPAAT